MRCPHGFPVGNCVACGKKHPKPKYKSPVINNLRTPHKKFGPGISRPRNRGRAGSPWVMLEVIRVNERLHPTLKSFGKDPQITLQNQEALISDIEGLAGYVKGAPCDAKKLSYLRSSIEESSAAALTKRKAYSIVDKLEVESTLIGLFGKVIFLKRFPVGEIWKLLMDGKVQATRGEYGFDNELGYMAGMMRGLVLMLETLDAPLTTDLYEKLHDACLRGVYDRQGNPMELGYRNAPNYEEAFGVDDDTWSQQGYEELLVRYNDWDYELRLGFMKNPEGTAYPDKVGQKTISLFGVQRSSCVRRVELTLQRYTDAAKNNEQSKLTAIVRCCQDLDQIHVFVDGNIRTIVFLVLNRLLLQNGLMPVIMDEPNVFDCKSTQQLIDLVKAGQEEFRVVAKLPKFYNPV